MLQRECPEPQAGVTLSLLRGRRVPGRGAGYTLPLTQPFLTGMGEHSGPPLVAPITEDWRQLSLGTDSSPRSLCSSL